VSIRPGSIRFLDPRVFFRAASTFLTWNPAGPNTDKTRPFICVGRCEGRSAWVALTTQRKPNRLWIRPAWIVGGLPRLRRQNQYLRDAAQIVVMTDATYSAAVRLFGERQAQLTDDGLTSVLIRVEAARWFRRGDAINFDHTLTINNDPPTDAGRDACAGVGAGGAE